MDLVMDTGFKRLDGKISVLAPKTPPSFYDSNNSSSTRKPQVHLTGYISNLLCEAKLIIISQHHDENPCGVYHSMGSGT